MWLMELAGVVCAGSVQNGDVPSCIDERDPGLTEISSIAGRFRQISFLFGPARDLKAHASLLAINLFRPRIRLPLVILS
jgi:hypothetical protein